MVHIFLLTLTLSALAVSVAAFPAAAVGTSPEVFSFSSWIEDIIANPDGNHLSPAEAVAAKDAAMAKANPLRERAWCRDDLGRANANDAAACLADLTSKGNAGIQCEIGQNQYMVEMCGIGSARIVASKSDSSAQGANCRDVARTGGLIFDGCWRADNTIAGSEMCVTNNKFQVSIASK